ncbi:hypothetical protein HDV00_001137 [Rhizophlyctis rosea]|nr:hypothetical protein HDV00_001137 [Rhizophlyctis rosea]
MSEWVGTRYNAEKKKIGNYYSTPILEFSMKCHLCSSKIIIHTDPKNAEYVIFSGARKREEGYTPEDAGVMALQDEKETEKLASDPFYRLEHGIEDKQKAVDALPVITQLQQHNDKYWKDPYTLSRTVRKRFREEKKVAEADQRVGEGIRDKHNLLLDIVPSDPKDAEEAKRIKWDPDPSPVESQKEEVHSSSIFSSSRPKTATPSPSSSSAAKPASRTSTPSLKHKVLSRERKDPFAISVNGFAAGGLDGVRRKPGAETQAPHMVMMLSAEPERESTVGSEELKEDGGPPTVGLVHDGYGSSSDGEE